MKALLFLLIINLFTNLQSFANMADSYGLESQVMATGQAFQAIDLSPYSASQNPALLGRGRHTTLGISFLYASDSFKKIDNVVVQNERAQDANLSRGSVNTDYADATGISFGLALPVVPKKLGLGLTGYVPWQWLAKVDASPDYVPTYLFENNRMQRFLLTGALGYSLFDNFSVGAGADLHFVTGASTAQNLNAQNATVTVGMEMKPSFSPIVGLFYSNILDIGLVYRGEANYKMELENNTDLTLMKTSAGDVGFPVVHFSSLSSLFYDPHRVVANMAYTFPFRGLRLGAGVEYQHWSRLGVAASASTFKTPDLPSAFRAPKTRNTINPSLGVSVPLGDIFELRTGYAYRPKKIVAQDPETNFIDTDRHTAAAGIGIRLGTPSLLSGPVQLDLNAQHHWLVSEYVQKQAGTIGAPGYWVGGNIWTLGASLSTSF